MRACRDAIRHAVIVARNGNPKAFDFPRAKFDESFDFSFSGLKTAVMREVTGARIWGGLHYRFSVDAERSYRRLVRCVDGRFTLRVSSRSC